MAEDSNQYSKSVQAAYDAVSGLDMSEEFKLEAFKVVLDRELGGVRSRGPASSDGDSDGRGNDHQPAEDWQKNIASALGITESQVLELYHMTDDGDIELVIEMRALPGIAAQATKHIAILYAGGRQAAGIEKVTSVERIRDVCESRFKVVDKKNFSTNINKLGSKFRVEGTGGSKTLQLINGAYKVVGETAQKYLGEAE